MFRQAFKHAMHYTYPYVGLRRKHDGNVLTTAAAFIVLNDEGWCITAKHVFDEIAMARNSIAGVPAIDESLRALKNQTGGKAKNMNREIRKLEHERADSLSDVSEIWATGADWMTAHPRVIESHPHDVADLAAFKLAPFAPFPDQEYPVFRSQDIEPGLSVCRIGFPWHQVEADFADSNFDVKSGFPAPMFALDGIVSQFAVEERSDSASRVTYIRTSTPGLRGQSGGPLFDTEGRLCGLQSSTIHLDLGFDATYELKGQPTTERQFLNVGQAVHVDDVAAFLDSRSIRYQSA